MSENQTPNLDAGDDIAEYYVYEEPLLIKLIAVLGWIWGWLAYWAVRMGFGERAESMIDHAIVMRRANPGAIRAIGRLNGLRGWPAKRRGKLLIHGKIHETGPFANKGFYATYHVAAPNKMRALALIRRFEWDAIPASLEIEEGELDLPDNGAEGVRSVAGGRCFYTDDD